MSHSSIAGDTSGTSKYSCCAEQQVPMFYGGEGQVLHAICRHIYADHDVPESLLYGVPCSIAVPSYPTIITPLTRWPLFLGGSAVSNNMLIATW